MLRWTTIGRRRALTAWEPKWIYIRKDASKKRLIRRIVIGLVLVAAVVGTSLGLTRLKPAAPSVDLSVVWRDTVKRGPMTREVRGLGTLVPEETMLIPATTDGRVQRILIRPGTPVKADSVVMILTSPELETDLLNAEYAMKAAEADYANLKVTLAKAAIWTCSPPWHRWAPTSTRPNCRPTATRRWPRKACSARWTPRSRR